MASTASDTREAAAGTAEKPDAEGAAREALRGGRAREALSILMDAYGDRLFRFCHSVVGDPELAAEVHEKLCLAAHESLAESPAVDSLVGWLFGIARNRCLDVLKVRRRWLARFQLGRSEPDSADPGPPADHRLAARERQHALLECLGELAPH